MLLEVSVFSSNMNSGISSPGAAAASCDMNDSGNEKYHDHGTVMITIIFFHIPLLYVMLQLAASAPGLVMLLFMLLLEIKHSTELVIVGVTSLHVPTYPDKLQLSQFASRTSREYLTVPPTLLCLERE